MMPAPAAKYLWQASSREQWEKLYLKWLVMWDGRQYMQWEYFTIGPGVALDKRAELWLEDADEFGIMFMSIGKSSLSYFYFFWHLAFPSNSSLLFPDANSNHHSQRH
jgi:hypothetical protein